MDWPVGYEDDQDASDTARHMHSQSQSWDKVHEVCTPKWFSETKKRKEKKREKEITSLAFFLFRFSS
jgi:hypothetical protein